MVRSARVEVVRASVHDEVRVALDALRPRVRALAAPARRPAFATPRPGGWEASLRALQDRARGLAASGPAAQPGGA